MDYLYMIMALWEPYCVLRGTTEFDHIQKKQESLTLFF